MSAFIDTISEWIGDYVGDLWGWFNILTREEWLVVLALVSVLGFLCMLGYGSRSKY
jgi:hypothetical protein